MFPQISSKKCSSSCSSWGWSGRSSFSRPSALGSTPYLCQPDDEEDDDTDGDDDEEDDDHEDGKNGTENTYLCQPDDDEDIWWWCKPLPASHQIMMMMLTMIFDNSGDEFLDDTFVTDLQVQFLFLSFKEE